MISAVVELIDPVGAFYQFFIEILIKLRRRLRFDKRKNISIIT